MKKYKMQGWVRPLQAMKSYIDYEEHKFGQRYIKWKTKSKF